MTDFTTIEAATVARTFLVDGLAIRPLRTRIGAFTGDVSGASTVVALFSAAFVEALVSLLGRHPFPVVDPRNSWFLEVRASQGIRRIVKSGTAMLKAAG